MWQTYSCFRLQVAQYKGAKENPDEVVDVCYHDLSNSSRDQGKNPWKRSLQFLSELRRARN